MNCKKCDSGQMVQKFGKNGAFMACNNFPNCKNTLSVEDGQATASIPVIKVDSVDHRTKEFHLTVEECRARALECAIKTIKPLEKMETAAILIKAKIFEVYIREGLINAESKQIE